MTNTPLPRELPVIRIFISSPGDVNEEREIVADIIRKLEKSPHVYDKATLRSVRFDDPLRQIPLVYNMTMQEAVNQGLAKPSECDIVVGILWGRMGTPLDKPLKSDGSQYLSGTEWEIEDAIRADVDLLIYRRSGAPSVPLPAIRDADALVEFQTQYLRVDDFVNRLRRPAPEISRPVYDFASIEEFRGKVEQHLIHRVQRILDLISGDGVPKSAQYVQLDALKAQYVDMVLNQTATIQLPILSAAGRPVIAALADLRIDLPLFVNHDHHSVGDEESDKYRAIVPSDMNDGFRLSHADSVMVDRADRHDDSRRECSIIDRLNGCPRAVVVGDPGSGKSTLLQWLTYHFASIWTGQDRQGGDLPNHKWFPVMIACRDLVNGPPPVTVFDILHLHLRSLQFSADAAASLAREFVRLFDDGHAILLIDGLDEIPDITSRKRFGDCLMSIANRFAHLPIIATSRVVGFEALADQMATRFDCLLIGPLDNAAKTAFIQLWGKYCGIPSARAALLAEQIITSRVTAKITDSVLLLAIVAQLEAIDGFLPDRRVDLFRRAVDIILRRQHGGSDLSRNEVVPHLEYLAYKMRIRGVQRLLDTEVVALFSELRQIEANEFELRRRSPEELLQACIKSVGLLNIAGKQVDKRGYERELVQFFHQSFQEYFAGQAFLYGRGDLSDRSAVIDDIRHLMLSFKITNREFNIFNRYIGVEPVFAERWQEVTRLLLADLPENDVDVAFDALLPTVAMDQPEARARTIFALHCLADEPALSKEMAARLYNAVIDTVSEFDGYNLKANTAMDQAIYSASKSRFSLDMKDFFLHNFIINRSADGIKSFDIMASILHYICPMEDGSLKAILSLELEINSSDSMRRCEAMARLINFLYEKHSMEHAQIWPEKGKCREAIFRIIQKGLSSDSATRYCALRALIWQCRARFRKQDEINLMLPNAIRDQVVKILIEPGLDSKSFTSCLEALTCASECTPPIRTRDWEYDLAVVADGDSARRDLPPSSDQVGRALIQSLTHELAWEAGLNERRSITLGAHGKFFPSMTPYLHKIAKSSLYTNLERFEAMFYLAAINNPEAVEALVGFADTPEDEDEFLYSRGLFTLLYLDNVEILANQIRKKRPHSDLHAYAYGMAGSADLRGREMLVAMLGEGDPKIRSVAEKALENEKLKQS
jgi:hypothetical protein